MSFGLCNVVQTFQHFMDDVLRGLDFCFAYLDDILNIYGLSSTDFRGKGSSSIQQSAFSEQHRSPSSVTRCSPTVPGLWKYD
jgi:hypothetical protein